MGKPKTPKPTASELELERRHRTELDQATRDRNARLKAMKRALGGRRTLLGSGGETGVGSGGETGVGGRGSGGGAVGGIMSGGAGAAGRPAGIVRTPGTPARRTAV